MQQTAVESSVVAVPSAAQVRSAVRRLVLPRAYREARENIWPSEGSFEWFLRRDRHELIAFGALLRLSRRWVIDPERMDAYVIAAAQRDAMNAV